MTVPSTTTALRVTVLGAGALGAALARACVAAGHETTVWNRGPSRLARLAADLPKVRATGELDDALAEVDVVVVALADADAVHAVLDTAERRAVDLRCPVVVLTSTTPEQARTLAARLGPGLLDGAAMSGTRLIGDPRALFLYAGEAATFRRAVPVLDAWGTARYLGADPGETPLWDTALLVLNLALLTGFHHAVALLGGKATPIGDVVLDYLPFATGLLREHAAQIDAGHYPPDDGTLAVLAAALDQAIDTAAGRGIATDVPTGLRTVIGRGIAAGHGEHGLASLAEALR